MAKIAGITILRNAKGKASKIVFDIKKHRAFIEDYLDHLAIEKHRNEPTSLLEEVLDRLDKKHGIKRRKGI